MKKKATPFSSRIRVQPEKIYGWIRGLFMAALFHATTQFFNTFFLWNNGFSGNFEDYLLYTHISSEKLLFMTGDSQGFFKSSNSREAKEI